MHYIFAAESCHKKKLYSRLSSRKPYFLYEKRSLCIFLRWFVDGTVEFGLCWTYFFFSASGPSLGSSQPWLMFMVIMLGCWSLYKLCCLCVCVVDGDETRCLLRRDLSSLLLASRLLRPSSTRDTLWAVYQLKRDIALKQRTIFAMWPSDSLWDRCLLIAKFRSAFCSCFIAKSYDRRRRLAAHRKSIGRQLHSPHVWRRPTVCTSRPLSVSVHTRWCHWSERSACVLVYGPDICYWFESMLYVR